MNLLDLPDDVLISTIFQFLNLYEIIPDILVLSRHFLDLKDKILDRTKILRNLSGEILSPKELPKHLVSLVWYHWHDSTIFPNLTNLNRCLRANLSLKSLRLLVNVSYEKMYIQTIMADVPFSKNLIDLSISGWVPKGRMVLPKEASNLRSLDWTGDLEIPSNIKYLTLRSYRNHLWEYDISYLSNLIYFSAPCIYFSIPEELNRLLQLKVLVLNNYDGFYPQNEAEFLKQLELPDLIYFQFFGDLIVREPEKIISFIMGHPNMKYYSSVRGSYISQIPPITKICNIVVQFRHYGDYNKIVVSGTDYYHLMRTGQVEPVDILEERVD